MTFPFFSVFRKIDGSMPIDDRDSQAPQWTGLSTQRRYGARSEPAPV